jgi:hypothetical protein
MCPLGAFSARRALAARFVVVELSKAGDSTDDICRLVHDNDSGGTETGLGILESIEVHELVITNMLGKDRSRRTTGDNGLQVVPTSANTTAVLIDQFAKRNAHLLLDCARVVDVARDTEELSTLVTFTAERCEPVASPSANGRCNGNGLDISNGGGAPEKSNCSRERRLKARLSRLSFQRFDEGSLLTANVGSHSSVDINIEIIAGAASVLADEPSLVCLLDGALEDGSFVIEFSANVDIGGGGVHGTSCDKTALDKLMGIFTHDLAIFASTRLSFVSVDD